MMKTLLTCLLIFLLSPVAALAKTVTPQDARAKIARIGTGDKARVKVKLKDGAKIEGYVVESRTDDFVVRNKATKSLNTVAYNDIETLDAKRKGNGKTIAILAGVGAGVVAAILIGRAVGCDGGAQTGGICGN
jgi:hypothetical protein